MGLKELWLGLATTASFAVPVALIRVSVDSMDM